MPRIYNQRLLIALGTLVLIALLTMGASSCSGSTSAQDQAQKRSNALQRQVYQSTHDLEFQNYNLRQKIADDPSTILWCTFFPPTVGQEPITVPIAGKLTSSNKRPYSGTYEADNGAPGTERPGPDHMFGSSSEYRYGFDPTRTIYYDFTSLPSLCTTQPLIYQRNKTYIAIDTAPTLNSIDKAAQNALKAGDAKKALQILKGAESK